MDAAVVFLLENLKMLVHDHVKLIGSAKDEFNALEKELGLIKKYLEETSKRQKTESAFKEWEKQIRDVVYEVEDTIDGYLVQMASKHSISAVLRQAISGNSLAKQVKFLREGHVKQVLNSATHFTRLSAADSSGEQELIGQRNPKVVKKWRIVGLEDETRTLVGYLKEHTERLEVIPIVDEMHSMKSDEILASLVYERLKIGRFLIILDNVCTLDAWNQIKAAFPMHNGMCKVLITTRGMNVAIRARPTREPFMLDFLKEEESWKLLQYEMYGALNNVNEKLVDVRRLIAKNCGGLPLAIIVIAGVLKDIETRKESIPLIKKEWDYLINDDQLGQISKILSLSYSKLPYDLRDCFLYMGIFPEDALIPAQKLIQLWIAEGFIQPKLFKSLEETAYGNLNDLINRNLVMVLKTKLNGEVKTCKLHDVVRSFCNTEAAVGKQNLFQEIRMKEMEGASEPNLKIRRQYRRLSIHSYVPDLFSQYPKILPRSFLCFPKEPVNLKPADVTSVCRALDLLRVFAAEKIKFPKFPFKMTHLIHLRYLTLSVTYELKVLPDAMFVNLWNLQTLIVETLSNTLEIKGDIRKMTQLRHFKTKARITLTCKDADGPGWENLQTFGKLSAESCAKGVFTKAKNLRALAIQGDLSKLPSEYNCLENLVSLNKLKLEHDASETPLDSLPEFPWNLKILTLTGTYLNWVEMSTVGKLENLEVLKLKENAFMGMSWEVSGGSFSSLKILSIDQTDLVCWTVSDHAFPKLKLLTLKNCEAFKEVPSALVSRIGSPENESDHAFPKLKLLTLKNCEAFKEVPSALVSRIGSLENE